MHIPVPECDGHRNEDEKSMIPFISARNLIMHEVKKKHQGKLSPVLKFTV